MLQMRGIFSPEYDKHLTRKDRVRNIAKEAIESIGGSTLFGKEIDIKNPEEVIATLYIMYKDYELFHERW